MSQPTPSDAEKAMAANAGSRVRQGAKEDKTRAAADREERRTTANPPASTDLTGPGGDPAEGKR